jgi:transcriptional regulator with XRE-family HTH domain
MDVIEHLPDTTTRQRLKYVRRDRGWTQVELSRRSGVPSIAISRVEKGFTKNLGGVELGKLAKALHVSVDYLLGLKEEME